MDWNVDKTLTVEGQIMVEGRKWLGLVPVDKKHIRASSSEKSIDEISKMNSKEFKQACQKAAEEFFWKELRIKNVTVVESKLSQNKKMVYYG